MSQSRRMFCLALSLLMFSAAPGLPAYAATAEIFDAAPADATAAEWIPVLGEASTQIGALSDPASQNIYGILGQIQLEAALHPYSKAAMEFTAELPAQANTPEKLLRLSAEVRAQILARAVTDAGAELSAQAEPLIARQSQTGTKLSSTERRVLKRLASAWFYLPQAQANAIREMARREASRSGLEKARSVAGALIGTIHPSLVPEVKAGARLMFERLRPSLTRPDSYPREDVVKDILAPQAIAAVAQASQSLDARGVPRNALWIAILRDHERIFSSLADREIVKALKQSSRWEQLVSAISLTAADVLARERTPEVKEILRQAGANEDLRLLPIPAWHPLAGRFNNVADSLAVYGPPLPPGLRVGRILRIPIIMRTGATLVIALVARMMFVKTTALLPHLWVPAAAFAGISMAISLYGSIIAHEFGHALMSRAMGIEVRAMVWGALGGLTYYEREARSPLVAFLIAFSGPAVNLALFGAASFLPALLHRTAPPLIALALTYFAGINLWMAAFNLLPIIPLDGGFMLLAFLSMLVGKSGAARISAKFSKTAAWLSLTLAGLIFILHLRLPTLFVIALVLLGLMGISGNTHIISGSQRIPAAK